jgi:hypothetical protein
MNIYNAVMDRLLCVRLHATAGEAGGVVTRYETQTAIANPLHFFRYY